ncbi:MAG: hypothetical protein WAM39_15785, partial [Bryobacteraceae bacterium]
CTLTAVHRISATLLIVLFGFSPISPAVFALDEDSNLPACCRRAGKHHCAKAANQFEPASGPAFNAGRCSQFPAVQAVPANRTATLPGTARAIFSKLVSHPASCRQAEAICRISYSRTGQKRGPPTILA